MVIVERDGVACVDAQGFATLEVELHVRSLSPAPVSRLPGPCCRLPIGVQHQVKLGAGGDGKFGEDLVQVILHGARADEKPPGYLRVAQTVASQTCDAVLLRVS
jgi:hypothetical protein